jgi:hypothetical protein
MRMWMVDPRKMCDRHLLGEHVEIHMCVGTLRRGRSVAGFLERGLLELHNLHKRHQRLVREMQRRGMRHQSPLARIRPKRAGRVDRHANLAELARRCAACRAAIMHW